MEGQHPILLRRSAEEESERFSGILAEESASGLCQRALVMSSSAWITIDIRKPSIMKQHWQFRLRALLSVNILWWPLSNLPVAYAEGIALGSTIQDCDKCPKLVVVPAGDFPMGDLADKGLPNEKPVHRVTISRPFAVGSTEITYA